MLIDKPKQYYSTLMFLRLGLLKRFCKGLDLFRFLPTLYAIYISQNMITRWQFMYSFYFSKRTYPQSDKNQKIQYGDLTNNVMQSSCCQAKNLLNKMKHLVSYVNIIIGGKVRKRESINQGLASHSGAPTRPTWALPV